MDRIHKKYTYKRSRVNFYVPSLEWNGGANFRKEFPTLGPTFVKFRAPFTFPSQESSPDNCSSAHPPSVDQKKIVTTVFGMIFLISWAPQALESASHEENQNSKYQSSGLHAAHPPTSPTHQSCARRCPAAALRQPAALQNPHFLFLGGDSNHPLQTGGYSWLCRNCSFILQLALLLFSPSPGSVACDASCSHK